MNEELIDQLNKATDPICKKNLACMGCPFGIVVNDEVVCAVQYTVSGLYHD